MTSKNNVNVLIEGKDATRPYSCTTNVVYPEILAWPVCKKKGGEGMEGEEMEIL
jgi:hypothetical protein